MINLLITIAMAILIIQNWDYLKPKLKVIVKDLKTIANKDIHDKNNKKGETDKQGEKGKQGKQGKQKKIKESFSLLNHYFVEPPNLYKMTTIDGGKLANMGVYATGTFYEQFANYFRHEIFPVNLVNTSGSTDIIHKIANDEIQLGICQEDLVYQAILNEKPFQQLQQSQTTQQSQTIQRSQPIQSTFQNLRFICALYYESFILVTHQYSNIYKWQDLKGKTVGFPEKGSGSYYNGIKLAKLAGLQPGVDFDYINALSMNRLANMFLDKDVDAIFLTTNQKNPYLINLANQRRIRFIGTKGISQDLLKVGFPFGFSKYINTSHFYANINSTNFMETYATRALLMTNSNFLEKATYKIVKEMFEKSQELQNVLTQYLYHRKLNNYIPDAFNPQEMFYANKILDIHSGAKKYYREIGLITNNPNPRCAKYATRGICPLPPKNDTTPMPSNVVI